VAKRVERQSPDHSAVRRQNVKPQRTSVDGCCTKDANIEQFAMMRLAVIQEFLAQEAIETSARSRLSVANFDVHLQSRELSGYSKVQATNRFMK
jgi:hypothetical protein